MPGEALLQVAMLLVVLGLLGLQLHGLQGTWEPAAWGLLASGAQEGAHEHLLGGCDDHHHHPPCCTPPPRWLLTPNWLQVA